MLRCLACKKSLKKRQKKFCSRVCVSHAITAKWFGNPTGLNSLASVKKRTRHGKSHHRWTGGELTKTCSCGKVFKIKKANKDKTKFCSQRCYWTALKGRPVKTEPTKRVEKKCEICPTHFTSYISQKRRFCGPSCRGVYAASRSKKSDTSIERIIESVLVELKIDFTKQHQLPNSLPDFFVPAYRLAIYADGDYWHSLPQNKARDTYVNRKLPALGYTVLRFSETLIKKDRPAVLQCVGSVVQSLQEQGP